MPWGKNRHTTKAKKKKKGIRLSAFLLLTSYIEKKVAKVWPVWVTHFFVQIPPYSNRPCSVWKNVQGYCICKLLVSLVSFLTASNLKLGFTSLHLCLIVSAASVGVFLSFHFGPLYAAGLFIYLFNPLLLLLSTAARSRPLLIISTVFELLVFLAMFGAVVAVLVRTERPTKC